MAEDMGAATVAEAVKSLEDLASLTDLMALSSNLAALGEHLSAMANEIAERAGVLAEAGGHSIDTVVQPLWGNPKGS